MVGAIEMGASMGLTKSPPALKDTETDLVRRERARFALAERVANFGYWRYEIATQKSMWSPGMYALLGTDPNVQTPSNSWLLDQISDDDRLKVQAVLQDAVIKKSGFHYRTQSKSDAAARVVDTHGEVELNDHGDVVAILGVCHDVSKEIEAERNRALAEHRYRLMAEEASDGILLYAPGGRIIFTSSALERITGRSSDEIEEAKFLRFVHPGDIEEALKVRTRPPRDQTLTACYRLLHRDGHYVWLEVTTRGAYDEVTGEYLNTIAVVRDISQRKLQELEMKAAREHAEAANRAKSAFLANMSHELRTPLNAIIGFTDIMRHEMFGALGHARYREYASLIFDSGQLLLDLISDVLDMAKIEAGKMKLMHEPVDLKPTIDECVRLVQGRAIANNIDVKLVMDHTISVEADRRALKQILLNLLSNAVKFSMRGGHVRVSAEEKGDRACILVQDDGIGISKEHLPRLGRAFVQVCDDPMLAKAGSGLGLALVRALLDEHHGSMTIHSEQGVGTQVLIELPLRQPLSDELKPVLAL